MDLDQEKETKTTSSPHFIRTHKSYYLVIAIVSALAIAALVVITIDKFKTDEDILITDQNIPKSSQSSNQQVDENTFGLNQESNPDIVKTSRLPADTSTWKTYINNAEGFTFKYPQNFYFSEFKKKYPDMFDVVAVSNSDISAIKDLLELDDSYKTLNVRIYYNFTFDTWIDNFSADLFSSIEPIEINGHKALKVESANKGSNIYVIQGKNKLYSLWIWPPHTPAFEGIVETFKIIE